MKINFTAGYIGYALSNGNMAANAELGGMKNKS
jgi:hypothetical protein